MTKDDVIDQLVEWISLERLASIAKRLGLEAELSRWCKDDFIDNEDELRVTVIDAIQKLE